MPIKSESSPPPVLTLSWVTPEKETVSISFGIDDLKQMPLSTFSTSTSWTSGERQFGGVSLKTFLQHIDVGGSVLKATALNDYAVKIPVSDAVENGPIIAYQMDGKDLTVRTKGPLWIVYPYDSNPRYQNETIFSRSIWQLKSIEILD